MFRRTVARSVERVGILSRWVRLVGAAAILLFPVAVASGLDGGTAVRPGVDPSTDAREFRLRLEPESHRIHVRVDLDLSEPTTVHLLFPAEWGGYPGLNARLRSVEAWGPAGGIAVEAAPEDLSSGHRVVNVERAGRITVSYELVLDPPAESRLYHRVSQLDRTGGHLLGSDLFPRIWLGRPGSAPQPGRIRLEGLPPDWRIATVAERVGSAYSVADLRETAFVVGPLRTRQVRVGPRTLWTAVMGDWPVSEDRLGDAVQRIAGALHGIARDAWEPGTYLYAAGRVPSGVPGLSVGGQVVGRSAIVYVGGGARPSHEYERWLHTTAHELLHWHIPQSFGFREKPPSWFAEGFTDYFALKALLASGLIDGPAFLDEIGDRLARYRSSPLFGQASMAEAQKDFWEDDAYRYIYDGGAVSALLLDLGFQARGRSLEHALAEARQDGRTSLDGLTAQLADVPENAWLRDWLAEGSNPEWDRQLQRYGLVWRDGRLESTDDWAITALSSIRP